jgi:hypothetical protein
MLCWKITKEPRLGASGGRGRSQSQLRHDRYLEPICGRRERGEMMNRYRLPREGRARAGVDLDDVIENACSNAGTRWRPTARIITP